MNALADTCILSHGWRRALLVLLAGAIAGLSAAPLFILPALFVAFPVLVWTLDGVEARPTLLRRLFGPAFRIGFFFGLGYFLVTIHWVGTAFFVDGGIMLAAMPFAVLLLATVLALFWALGIALARLVWSAGTARLFALAAGLSLAEIARGTLFTGFPFNLLGYALTANLEMMQAASLVGVYGLTFVAILIAATPALVWPSLDRPLAARLAPLFLAIAVIAAQLAYGHVRLRDTLTEPREDIALRLVQPVVPQDLKWQAFAREEIVQRLIDLTTAQTGPDDAGLADITHIVWPEMAIPFFISTEPELFARIARMIPEDVLLLTGAPREPYTEGAAPYNSIFAINTQGEILSSYDKTHLVPIGEVIPFQEQLSAIGLGQFVPGADGWAAGAERRLFEIPGLPGFLPLICYEAVYSGGLGDAVADAEFILVLTNDAWFDGSFGVPQSFHHARLRAVEEGLAMVRVANSGISALIDPLGRVKAQLPAGLVGTLDGAPDRPIAPPPFAQWRHWPFALMVALGALIALAGHWRWRRHARAA